MRRGPRRDARPRSGAGAFCRRNSVGVIDNSYCGTNDEWKLPVYATRDTVLEKGDRICQFRIYEVQPPITFEECETLSETDRGGFGLHPASSKKPTRPYRRAAWDRAGFPRL